MGNRVKWSFRILFALLAVWVSAEIYNDCKTGYDEVVYEKKLREIEYQKASDIFPDFYQ